MGTTTSSSVAARTSVVVGVLVLVTKTLAWHWTGSVALLGDAIESIVNVVAAGLVMWALHFSSQPADDEHPWGHGKAEYFSAGVEGTLVVVAALAIAHEAVQALTGHARAPVLGFGLVVSLSATAMNLALGLWLGKVARENDSAAIRADSKHVLADVATTGGSLVGLFLAKATGRLWIDPVIAIAVAAHLLGEGVEVVRGAASALLDEALRPEELATLARVIGGALEPGESFHDLRTRRAGARVFIEIHLVVDASLTVLDSHARCDALEAAVAEALPGAELTVHVEPDVAPHSGPARS
jgi:cation diffusion facilitator family transporter